MKFAVPEGLAPATPWGPPGDSREPAAVGDRATLQPQAWFPQPLMGTGSGEVSQSWSLCGGLRRSHVNEGPWGAAGAASPRRGLQTVRRGPASWAQLPALPPEQ